MNVDELKEAVKAKEPDASHLWRNDTDFMNLTKDTQAKVDLLLYNIQCLMRNGENRTPVMNHFFDNQEALFEEWGFDMQYENDHVVVGW